MSERGSDRQSPRLPGVWTLIRDVLSFLGGWTLIFMEVQRSDLRESVLVLAAGIVGVPAAAVGAQSIADAITRRNGTAESSSSPQVEAGSSSAGTP